MDAITGAAVIQAGAAVVIVGLTWQLSRTAKNALDAARKQAAAAEQAIEAANKQAEVSAASVSEMRKSRHLGAVPMLAITFGPLDTSQPNRVLTMMRISNGSDYPALNIRVTLSEAIDRYEPQELKLATPSPLPVIAPHDTVSLPADMSRFTPGQPPQIVRTNWVCARVDYEGLLGAKVYQEWYWEPYEWEGIAEPVPGHGEKLVLFRVTGSSGADPLTTDIEWKRAP